MIIIFNDGKDGPQSIEAVFSDKNEFGFLLLPDFTGYGATEAEAAGHLIQQLEEYQAKLKAISTEIVDRRKGVSGLAQY